MQVTVARARGASSEREHGAKSTSPATTALIAGVLGLLANVAYVLAALPHGAAAAPVIASFFGPLIAGASVALYLLLASERATRVSSRQSPTSPQERLVT